MCLLLEGRLADRQSTATQVGIPTLPRSRLCLACAPSTRAQVEFFWQCSKPHRETGCPSPFPKHQAVNSQPQHHWWWRNRWKGRPALGAILRVASGADLTKRKANILALDRTWLPRPRDLLDLVLTLVTLTARLVPFPQPSPEIWGSPIPPAICQLRTPFP